MAEREKEVIVTTTAAAAAAARSSRVVLLIAVLVVLFLLFGRGLMSGDDTTDIKADIKIDTPASARTQLGVRAPAPCFRGGAASAGAPIRSISASAARRSALPAASSA